MIYYSETGERLPAEEIDLEKGYLVDRKTVHHEAETHTTSKTLPGGVVLTWVEVDKPAWDEVTEKTYILYSDHPSEMDKLEAQIAYTALVTDTMLEV